MYTKAFGGRPLTVEERKGLKLLQQKINAIPDSDDVDNDD